jgi:hypothetical protein
VLDLQTTSLRYLAAATVVQVAVLLVAVPTLGPPGAGVAAIALVLTWAALLLPAVQLRLARFATSATAAARIR